MKKNTKNNLDIKKLALIVTAVIAVIVIAFAIKLPNKTNSETAEGNSDQVSVVKDNDIVIQTKDITETATFYPANINGTDLEVFAVKATDGSIRTAFNTCQVCYSSGKGYYKQEGDKLVCQNCGNQFGTDDVEVVKGGCNPVPITSEYKTVSDDTITISKDVLTQAIVIFENWK
jgi:uncharacterized membrane protein